MHNISGHLRNGIPELSIPPLDPLPLGESELINIEGMKITSYDAFMWGFWDFNVNDLRVNFEEKYLWINITFPSTRVESKFKALAKIIQIAEQHGSGIMKNGNSTMYLH